MSDSAPASRDYQEVAESTDFVDLQRRHRSFVFPLAVLFLIWYFVYVLLAAYAHDFMATPVFGSVNVGLLFGLGQFVTTFVITHLYVAHANKRTDPIADEMRERLEHHDYARSTGDGTTGGAARV